MSIFAKIKNLLSKVFKKGEKPTPAEELDETHYRTSNKLQILDVPDDTYFTDSFLENVDKLLKKYECLRATLKINAEKHILFTAVFIGNKGKIVKEIFYDHRTNNYKIRYVSETVQRKDIKKILYKNKEVLTLKGFDTAEAFLRNLIESNPTDEYKAFLSELETAEFFLKEVKELNLGNTADKIIQ